MRSVQQRKRLVQRGMKHPSKTGPADQIPSVCRHEKAVRGGSCEASVVGKVGSTESLNGRARGTTQDSCPGLQKALSLSRSGDNVVKGSFPGTVAPPHANLTLLLEIAMGVGLLIGVFLARRQRFRPAFVSKMTALRGPLAQNRRSGDGVPCRTVQIHRSTSLDCSSWFHHWLLFHG